MSPTLAALRQEVGLVSGTSIAGTTTAGGSSTTFIDTTLLTDSGANANIYNRRYALLTSGTYSGQVRRISSYTGSTGTITVVDAYGGTVATSVTYEIHSIDPTRIKEAINRALEKCLYRTYFYPNLVTDGDMETSGVTNWTGSSSTPTKSTSIVKYGTQALVATNSAASGYVRTASISVTPDDQYYLYATVRPDNFEVSLIAYDVTNSAAIKTVTHTGREWKRLWTIFAIPSGCRQIQVRLQATSASAVTYWDNVILQCANKTVLALPSWVTENWQVDAVEMSILARDDESGVSFVDEELWDKVPFTIEQDRTAVNAYYLAFKDLLSNYRYRVVALRPYATLSADSDTTTILKDWVVAGAILQLLENKWWTGPSNEVGEYQKQLSAAVGKWRALCGVYQPRQPVPIVNPWG